MRLGRVGRPGLIATAARTAVIAGTAQAVTGSVANRQYEKRMEAAAPPQPAPSPEYPAPAPPPSQPPPAAVPAGDDLLAQLERLAQLRSAGMLDDAEFAAAKARLLG